MNLKENDLIMATPNFWRHVMGCGGTLTVAQMIKWMNGSVFSVAAIAPANLESVTIRYGGELPMLLIPNALAEEMRTAFLDVIAENK